MVFSDPLIGKQLGDYRIDDLLGRGGMAHVYRGYDPKLAALCRRQGDRREPAGEGQRGRVPAALPARSARDCPSESPEYRRRLPVRRGRRRCYYMAMVFIEGRDLGQILKEHDANGTLMPLDQVLQVDPRHRQRARLCARGGVIHRDIKPSNIMVTLDHHAVLTDFGLALSVPEGTLGNTFGSAHYIAPEQAISSANAVAQSDLYSLGVVLYQMLTGKVPFDDPSAMSVALMHLSDPPPLAAQHQPGAVASGRAGRAQGARKRAEPTLSKRRADDPGAGKRAGGVAQVSAGRPARSADPVRRRTHRHAAVPGRAGRAVALADRRSAAALSPSEHRRTRLYAGIALVVLLVVLVRGLVAAERWLWRRRRDADAGSSRWACRLTNQPSPG